MRQVRHCVSRSSDYSCVVGFLPDRVPRHPSTATVLQRKAVVYVRQSAQTQVQTNLESQRRQYDLVDEARRRGFHDVEVIDGDLGRSASGTVARPGLDRLVA